MNSCSWRDQFQKVIRFLETFVGSSVCLVCPDAKLPHYLSETWILNPLVTMAFFCLFVLFHNKLLLVCVVCVAELWCSTSLQATLPIWLMFMAVNTPLSLKSLIVTSIPDSNPELIRTAEWGKKKLEKRAMDCKKSDEERKRIAPSFSCFTEHHIMVWRTDIRRITDLLLPIIDIKDDPFSSLLFFCFILNFFSVLLLGQKSLEVLSLSQHNLS